MKKYSNNFKAFTLVETMLVIGLIVLISAISMDFFLSSASKFAVNNATNDIVEFFKNVQAKNVNYGVPAFADANKTYYGLQFVRSTTAGSYYFSYKKYATSTEENRPLSNYVYFSSLTPGQSLDLKFCADPNYIVPVAPFDAGNTLQFLCSPTTTCDTKYTITVKAKFGSYEKSVVIDTSANTQCKPSIYKQ